MKPGDVVVGMLPGAAETKVRPAVIVASDSYLRERPDVLVGVLTTKIPLRLASTDYVLKDWHAAGLRARIVLPRIRNYDPPVRTDSHRPLKRSRLEQCASARAKSVRFLNA